MLNTVHSNVRIDCRRDRVAGIDGRILRNGDVNYRGWKKRSIIIYILNQEPDLDQPEDFIGKDGHFHLIETTVLTKNARAQLLSINAVGGGEDLSGILLHADQRDIPSLVHEFEL